MTEHTQSEAEATVSRQRRWQLKQRAKGLCVQCGSDLGKTKLHCNKCRVKANARQNARNAKLKNGKQ